MTDAPLEQQKRQIEHLRRRLDRDWEDLKRVSDKRFQAAVFTALAVIYSMTGFIFRMDPPDFVDAVFICAGVPIAIGCGIWWWDLRNKEQRLSECHWKLEDELNALEEAYLDPNR